MPNDKSAVEEFLGDIGKPKDNPFIQSDPFDPREETKEDEVTVEEDKASKPLPFHKDPKVIKFIEKEVAKRTPKPSEEIRPSKESEDEITSVLERIIGNDTPEKTQAVKDFRKVLGGLEEKGAQRALAQLQEKANEERQEEVRVQEQLDSSFEEIEEAHGVDLSSNAPQARKMRSDFVDYIHKIAPKNEDGEVASFPDIPAAWEEFQERGKRVAPANTKAKELASRGMTRSTDTSVAPPQTAKNWNTVEKWINNLTS